MQFLPKDVPERLDECRERVCEAIYPTIDEEPGIVLVTLANICGTQLGASSKSVEEVETACAALAELILGKATDTFEMAERNGMLDHQLAARYGGQPDA
ncbi:hypothetical protein [uncultured Roseovarius sp.]|uniref:hypothetical protein n=1 Tax=uncultured Roseovarius sp. TaxID=293344 RepID=UPI0026300696|nr:hypothetical protein [uncultured Roseovarius sp.]